MWSFPLGKNRLRWRRPDDGRRGDAATARQQISAAQKPSESTDHGILRLR